MNTLATHLFRVALLSIICAAPAWAQECRFSSDRAANFSGTIKKVVISAGEGSLKVTGTAAGVNAKGLACASAEPMLSKITLESRREGDIVYLTVAVASGGMGNMFSFNKYASLDLDITVPRTAQLNITDTGGDIELSDVGPTQITDDAGDLLLKNINGELDVTDESGEMRIISVAGRLTVKDTSGGVDIEDVRSDVKITLDSSGDIAIAKVTGNVDVVEDASGDISVREVTGNVVISKDGSGDIRVTEVSGKLSVIQDSSGEILHDHVRGSVRIPARS
jgi:DUF4097 and DUF4098 domain-containing protein YvlB